MFQHLEIPKILEEESEFDDALSIFSRLENTFDTPKNMTMAKLDSGLTAKNIRDMYFLF